MSYIPILDAGIALRPNSHYKPYDKGKKEDIFIKIKNDEDLIAQVWPKDSVFPDFLNDDAFEWWEH